MPKSFLGVAIEGPSREGFLLYGVYRTSRGDSRQRQRRQAAAHPARRLGPRLVAGLRASRYGRRPDHGPLDKESTVLEMPADHRKGGSRFDRFGLVTTWIDGNGQRVYFDDLTYTIRQ